MFLVHVGVLVVVIVVIVVVVVHFKNICVRRLLLRLSRRRTERQCLIQSTGDNLNFFSPFS